MLSDGLVRAQIDVGIKQNLGYGVVMHKLNHRITWKEFGKRIQVIDGNASFRWSSRGEGRYWKRRLSKARRRAWKDSHQRGLLHWERLCNWKNW